MPKISVIVPVYKVEKYIHKCIDSILRQSFQDFDLVLVDDGSPDTCPQICDDYTSRDKRIIVIHKKNGGLSDARNAGIDWAMENSSSEWLAFVDSDDYLHPDYLQSLYQTAMKEEADLVVCDFIRVNDQEEIIEDEHSFVDLVTADKKELFEIMYSEWRIVPAWNKLYHKTIFSQLRFAFGKIHEDNYAIHHVFWNCRKAAFIPAGRYYYRIRNDGIMATKTPKSRLDRMEALIEQYEFGLEHGVLPPDVGTTAAYLSFFMDFQADYDEENERRFRKLKRRFGRIYFRRRANRTVKRYVGYYCPGFTTSVVRFGKGFSKKRRT